MVTLLCNSHEFDQMVNSWLTSDDWTMAINGKKRQRDDIIMISVNSNYKEQWL